MDEGQSVWKAHAFITTEGKPWHWIQDGVLTGMCENGVPLVKIDGYGGIRFEPKTDEWHTDRREALTAALAMLNERAAAFEAALADQRAKIAAQLEVVEVQA